MSSEFFLEALVLALGELETDSIFSLWLNWHLFPLIQYPNSKKCLHFIERENPEWLLSLSSDMLCAKKTFFAKFTNSVF
jgi:hypothetical protein